MSARQFLRFLDSVQNYTKAIRQRQGILLSFAKVSDFSKLFGYIKTPLIRQGFSVLSNQFSFSYFCQRKKTSNVQPLQYSSLRKRKLA